MTLTQASLRGLLVGTDKSALSSVLAQVMQDGVTLPDSVLRLFGVKPVAAGPAAPRMNTTPSNTAQPVQRPRFALQLAPGARLDYSVFAAESLGPGTKPAVARTVTVSTPPSSAPSVPPQARQTARAVTGTEADRSTPRKPVLVEERLDDATGSGAHDAAFDPVKQYLKEIGKFALLSAQDEIELAKRIEAGVLAQDAIDRMDGRVVTPKVERDLRQLAEDGQESLTRFLQANLRLVVSIAKKYAGRGVPFLDLIQEGNLALINAVEKFDHTMGFKFSTMATLAIRQAMSRGIANQSRTIRVPGHAHDLITALHRSARELELPRPEENLAAVAARADIPLAEARKHLSHVRRTVSLESLMEALSDDALHAAFDPTEVPVLDEPWLYGLTAEEVHDVLGTLSERTRHIVERRYGFDGEPATLDEIGQELRLTRERVRQILAEEAGPVLDALLRNRILQVGCPVPPPRKKNGRSGQRKPT